MGRWEPGKRGPGYREASLDGAGNPEPFSVVQEEVGKRKKKKRKKRKGEAGKEDERKMPSDTVSERIRPAWGKGIAARATGPVQ